MLYIYIDIVATPVVIYHLRLSPLLASVKDVKGLSPSYWNLSFHAQQKMDNLPADHRVAMKQSFC